MKAFYVSTVLIFSLMLAGCGIGGHTMTGMVLEKDLKSIKPYIAYWQKEGITEESRLRDWMACGGMRNGGFGIVSEDRLPGESMADATTRQQFAFQRCMLRSGYRYTGDCSSEYMKARPLCGAS